jgi:hypothetical protein
VRHPKFRSPVLAAVFRAAVAQGWTWRYAGPPQGGAPISLSVTAYDGKANLDLVARAKRAGLRI